MLKKNTLSALIPSKFALPLLLVTITVLVNFPILQGQFLDDDFILIVNNPGIKKMEFLWENASRDYFDIPGEGGTVGYYRPLTRLSFMADYALWGLDPKGFRATNLMLHTAVTVLLYVLAHAFGLQHPMAVFVGAIFAVYPLHVSSVSISTARSDLWAALFYALSFICYIKFRNDDKKSFLFLSGVSFLLALFGKEVAASLPLMIFTRELFLPGNGHDTPIRSRLFAAARHTLPFAGVVGLYMIWRWVILNIGWAPIETPLTFSLQLAAWPVALIKYLHLLLFPHQLTFIEYVPIPSSFQPLHALLILLSVGGLLFLLYFSNKGSASSLWFLFTILSLSPMLAGLGHIRNPESSRYLALAERFLYLPSLFMALTWGQLWSDLIGKTRYRRVLCCLGLGFIGLLSAITLLTIPNYYSTANLFLSSASSLHDVPETRLDSHMKTLRYWSLGLRYLYQKEYQKAVQAYAQARKYKPYHLQLGMELAHALSEAGQYEEALQVLDTMLTPSFLKQTSTDDIRRSIVGVRMQYGQLLMNTQHPQEAIHQFNIILNAWPNYHPALKLRGKLLLQMNLPFEARRDWETLVNENPDDVENWVFMGKALCEEGNRAEAKKALSQALKLVQNVTGRKLIQQNLQKIEKDCTLHPMPEH